MTYWLLDAVFLAVVAAVAIAAIVVRRPPRWASVALGVGILLVVSAVFDNVMIGIGLVGYDRSHISGAFIGVAPVEDLAYAIAAAVLLPSLWSLLHRPSTGLRDRPSTGLRDRPSTGLRDRSDRAQ